MVEPSVLAEALTEQIALKVEWLCGLRPKVSTGTTTAKICCRATAASPGPVVEPLAIVWRAIRLSSDQASVDATLARAWGREMRGFTRDRAWGDSGSPRASVR